MKTKRSSRSGPVIAREDGATPDEAGIRIRELRLKREICQAELAEAIGYAYAHSISHIETGYRTIPDGKVIKAAAYFGVDPRSIRSDIPIDPSDVTEKDAARFFAMVNQTDSCWNWTGAINELGYGRFRWGGRVSVAHRFAYEMVNPPISKGKEVDHICHNRACVNPAHLRLVTRKQNMENRAGAQSNGSSGFRGVRWVPATGRWSATVGHNGKPHFAGTFATAEEAGQAARKLRMELFTHNDKDRRTA